MERKIVVKQGPGKYLVMYLEFSPGTWVVGTDLVVMAKEFFEKYALFLETESEPAPLIQSIEIKEEQLKKITEIRDIWYDLLADNHDGGSIVELIIRIEISNKLIDSCSVDYYEMVDTLVTNKGNCGAAWFPSIMAGFKEVWSKMVELCQSPEELEKESVRLSSYS